MLLQRKNQHMELWLVETQNNRRLFSEYLQLKAAALVHDVIELSLEWGVENKHESVTVLVQIIHFIYSLQSGINYVYKYNNNDS